MWIEYEICDILFLGGYAVVISWEGLTPINCKLF